MTKVFNVGFFKTGTTSFEFAASCLGYNPYHGHFENPAHEYVMAMWIHRDYREIRRMTDCWDAYSDAPWGGTDLYKKLFEWYPDAKYVQTVRDSKSWYRSLERMLTECSDGNLATALETFHANGRRSFSYFFEQRFATSTLVGAAENIIAEYERHNCEVAEFFTKQGANFLRFDSVGGEGWEKLCPFLGKPIPDVQYPHANVAPVPAAAINQEAVACAAVVEAIPTAQASTLLPHGPHATLGSGQTRMGGAVRRLRRMFGA